MSTDDRGNLLQQGVISEVHVFLTVQFPVLLGSLFP